MNPAKKKKRFGDADMLDAVGQRHASSWATAVEENGLSAFGAVARGSGRFLLWHVAQPIGYLAVYGCALAKGDFDGQGAELDGLQQQLGGIVAVRELLYLVLLVVAVCVKPAFLLVDVGASVRDEGNLVDSGYGFLALYVLAPEKFVVFGLLAPGGECMFYALFCGLLLDLCGPAALCAGLAAGNLPPPPCGGAIIKIIQI